MVTALCANCKIDIADLSAAEKIDEITADQITAGLESLLKLAAKTGK